MLNFIITNKKPLNNGFHLNPQIRTLFSNIWHYFIAKGSDFVFFPVHFIPLIIQKEITVVMKAVSPERGCIITPGCGCCS